MKVQSPISENFLGIGPSHMSGTSFGAIMLHAQCCKIPLLCRQEFCRLGEVRKVKEDEDTEQDGRSPFEDEY